MTRFFTTVLAVTFLGSAMAVSAHAQDSTDSLLESPPQPVNVRIELVITDQRGDDAPIVKRMNVTVGDGLNGSIRSQSHVQDIGEMPLHADAKPRILSDGKILLSLQLQYDFPDDSTTAGRQMLRRQLQESIGVILKDGEPLTISQSADAITDRQVTVQATATILQ